MPPLRVHHLVRPEFAEARGWYAGRSPWAAESFSQRFDLALDRIASRPRSLAPLRSIFRRVRLPHFPYMILFHAAQRRTSVLAVHTRSEPDGVLQTLRTRLAELS